MFKIYFRYVPEGVTSINDGAHVINGDITADNGVLHIIDKVLLPAKYATQSPAVGK